MSIIESIRTFICACPFLKNGVINVDYLGSEPTEYTIEGVPTSSIVRQDIDGGALKQYTFYFASREYYGADVLTNIENSNFYEEFAAWLKAQNDSRILPELGAGKTAQEIEALSTGYMLDAAAKDAQYRIQCRLIYYED